MIITQMPERPSSYAGEESQRCFPHSLAWQSHFVQARSVTACFYSFCCERLMKIPWLSKRSLPYEVVSRMKHNCGCRFISMSLHFTVTKAAFQHHTIKAFMHLSQDKSVACLRITPFSLMAYIHPESSQRIQFPESTTVA